MVTYTIYLKELSASSTWQDITHAVAVDKIPIRKGFGSTADAIDMGSVSLDIHMESLEAAALLHVSRKQVLIQKDGVTIFEGISYNDADVEMQMNTNVVYASLKFKPYSSMFEQAKVPSDAVYTDLKVCDPSDTANSLVHVLFDLLIDNLTGDLPDILAASYSISTTILNQKTLPIVLLEKGESIEDYLTDVLYQNGYAYYMDLFSIVIVEPFKADRVTDQVVDITELVESPSISQEPYITEKKAVVRFPRVEQYTEETVYELNSDRDTIDGSPSQVDVIEAGDYYPLDEEDPAELDADYETDRENDNIELVYAESPRLDVNTRKNADSGDETVPAYITVSERELTPTGLTVQLYNQLAEEVSLRNIRVIADIAYYRNWASIYEDNDTDATDTEEIDGLYMPDRATAQDFIRCYRMEVNAEKTPVTFESSLLLAPNTLISIAELPYKLLVRSVTDYNDRTGVYEYEAVAYSVITVSVGTRIRVTGQGKPIDGFSPVPVRLYALGTEEAPYEDAVSVSDDTRTVTEDNRTLGIDAAWSTTRPTPGEGEYVWYIIGWYTPPQSWPSEWTTPVIDTGLNAYALQISAPEGTTIRMSGRGVLQTDYLKFTAILNNILPTSVVWSSSDGTLDTIAGDDYSRRLDCSTVSADQVTITITASVAGSVYTASIGVQRIRDTFVPENIGTVTALPTSVDGEPLGVGDYFLVGAEFTEGATTYLKGQIWEYTGAAWAISTDQSKAMSLLGDFADLDVDVESTVIGNAVIKKLVALEATIGTIFSQFINIKSPGYIKSDNYTPGSVGYKIVYDGSTEFNNVTARGAIIAGSGSNVPVDYVNGIDNYVTQVAHNSDLESIQSQIDGNITTWFYSGEPTLSNAPYTNWTTDEERNNHLGDLYYDTATGYAYRFANSGGYTWLQITDQDVTTALANASAAQDTADAKRRVFVAEPTPPYDIGDLWSEGSDGDLKRCKTAKGTGDSYSSADWENASKYDKTSSAIESGIDMSAGWVEMSNGGSQSAGMSAEESGDDEVRMWAGASRANKATAPFRVIQNGKMYAKDAEIEGDITAHTGIFKGSVDSPGYSSLPAKTGTDIDVTTTSDEEDQWWDIYNAVKDTLNKYQRYTCSHSTDGDVSYFSFESEYLYFYDSSFNVIATIETGYSTIGGDWYDSDYNGTAFSVTITYGDGEIFKFKDLPQNDSGLEDGQVWNDNGTLKIHTT